LRLADVLKRGLNLKNLHQANCHRVWYNRKRWIKIEQKKAGNMENTFRELEIEESILKSLDLLEFTTPTDVQKMAIPKVLEGKDLIVVSKTGSGKTGAFGIPMLQLLQKKDGGPQALILTPTRELAVQVDRDITAMSKFKDIRTTTVYGQHSMNVELEALEKGIEIVTGTPGRVLDHLRQGSLITGQVRILVLDEADRMLDMGFIDQVQRIIAKLPKDRVTMLFSATMPDEIQALCQRYMNDPMTIELESDTKTVDSIEQVYFKVERDEKRKQLYRILCVENPKSCMVFCNTRVAVDRVNDFLNNRGFSSKAIHGANSQSSRLRAIDQFKKGTFQILCATDVAARGIHVEDLSLVINYDVPQEKDSYVHRIGRTGRAGHGGKAITLVTKDDLFSLYEIEEHVGALIEELPLPSDEAFAAAEKPTPRKTPVRTGERKNVRRSDDTDSRGSGSAKGKSRSAVKRVAKGQSDSDESGASVKPKAKSRTTRREDKVKTDKSPRIAKQPAAETSQKLPSAPPQKSSETESKSSEPVYRRRVVVGAGAPNTSPSKSQSPVREPSQSSEKKGFLSRVKSLLKK
jgi:superfamily II DNA/RNA helicase